MFKSYTFSLKALIVSLAVLLQGVNLFAQSNVVYLNSSASQIWKVKPQADVSNPADIIQPNYNMANWVNAVVPGTVFASYVAAGLEKDPNFGDNIYKVDRAKYDRSFWYRTEFKIPANYTQKNIWLNFKGVNRKADVYVNGSKLGTLDGFMQRGQFDITALVNRGGINVLTLLVSIPKQPLANVGSPNYVASASWDWIPYVPGLNSGITDKVYLSNTGDLTMQDPWIQTKLPTLARADLSVAVEVKNNSSGSQQGFIKGVITPGNIEFTKKVYVDANGVTTVKFDARNFEQLMINRPKLWWPNGYGEPNLYNCKLSLVMGNEVSDVQELKFGIKKYSYDTVGHVLHVAINGTPVFIKGGDWGMAEYLLRCRGKEYDTKVRLHKEMNFNMIRNWTGSTTDEEFYDACDKYGIMVWDDFWLNANPNLPADLNVFNANVIEKIKRFRNHPAIAVWCAENEGWSEAPVNGWLKENLATFDGGDRWYQPNSHAENLTGSGPWDNRDPRYYFTPYPIGTGGNIGWGLRTELGTAVFTNFESFKKFMPKENWWPRNQMWNQHFFGELAFNAGPDNYDRSITVGYGAPTGIEDYCRKAQFVNIETNKAMFEGWQDHIGEDASGLMTWMSQSAYPSMVWQTYDYYYDLTGAFWGAKKACEPIHIQWNPVNNAIKVVNTTRTDVDGLTAQAEIYNLDGQLVKQYSQTQAIDALSNTAVECFRLNLSESRANLALNKPVYASSSTNGDAGQVNDGNNKTRWASNYNDNEWIYVDLGKQQVVNGVGLNWEDAYPKSFKIQVSDDAKNWRDIYSTTDGRAGQQQVSFTEAAARYVRMQGVERATSWGYSLWNFEVYQGDVASPGLTDVHFIKLKLTDKTGKLISDNFYWRGNKRRDYTALNSIAKVDLKVNYRTVKVDGKYFITAQITNPASSKAVAFGIRVQALRTSTREQILPAIMNDNYFSLLKGETKTVKIEVADDVLGNDNVRLIAEPYNNRK
ncbi:discoidin domain-containing protein [Mucilaginibacter flavus]|uniref:discoidin domain-containing protein n=1 Tax=Mucilaginibacter flavus TaxID=931504 RepID=UPI0025B4942C|nr:discoidin domain-containing protein [Mucilaginibacter flavus]MDN3582417.1 discoidin domain-containing protein [Mucilaginibacter flavus]